MPIVWYPIASLTFRVYLGGFVWCLRNPTFVRPVVDILNLPKELKVQQERLMGPIPETKKEDS